jgi:dCMP deaminase
MKGGKMKLVIGLTAQNGAGKGAVAKILQNNCDFKYISCSDILRDILINEGKELTRENLQNLGNKLRKEKHSGYLGECVREKIENDKLNDYYVVDSIRNPNEIKELRKLSNFKLCTIRIDDKKRYMFLQKRNREKEPLTFEEFLKCEDKENSKTENGLRIKDCIVLADYKIDNNSSMNKLKENTISLLTQIKDSVSQGYRPSKERYYLEIAKQISQRSNCLAVKIGCIIVKDDQIISTGYVGAPRKTKDCFERGECIRRKLNIKSGTHYEMCRSVHAEQNAIINAARNSTSILGADMYLYAAKRIQDTVNLVDALPCFICKKMIINAGIKRFIGNDKNNKIKVYDVNHWIEDWKTKDLLDDQLKYHVDYEVKD